MGNIADCAKELFDKTPLPAPWEESPDEQTGNLLINNGSVGFCVTRECFEQWTLDRIRADVFRVISDIDSSGKTDVVTVWPMAARN